MGLDVRLTKRRRITCPDCGKIIDYKELECIGSGGRAWYDVLKSIGYYVPYDQRTEENDWYSKDMVLNESQVMQVRKFAMSNEVYNHYAIANMIAAAMVDGDDVVINADW